jgi:DNA repair exonuclease SbcCD ATPase subunit
MANPILTTEQRENLFEPLYASVTKSLEQLSAGDTDVLFALRRKLFKELSYQERGSPMLRGKIKQQRRKIQSNICPVCNKTLPENHAHLHRLEAKIGYTVENTQLVHSKCHISGQELLGYK